MGGTPQDQARARCRVPLRGQCRCSDRGRQKQRPARSWHKRQKQRRDSDQNGDCQKVSNFVVQPGIVRRRSNYCHFIASCLARHRVLLKINRRRSCRPGNCVSCKSSLSPQQLKKEDAGSAAPNRRDASYEQSGSVNIMPVQLRYPEEFEWVAHLTSGPAPARFIPKRRPRQWIFQTASIKRGH